MKSTEDLRREYDRLMGVGDFDGAELILEKLGPVSDDEWLRILNEAPMDDEPLTVLERQRFAEFDAFLARQARRQAG